MVKIEENKIRIKNEGVFTTGYVDQSSIVLGCFKVVSALE